jgi:hypothetical protein
MRNVKGHLPNFIEFDKDNKPSHGEYIVLLKKTIEEDYPYLALANYTYHNKGEWYVNDDERGSITITKQVQAWLEPRFSHSFLIDGDN